MSERVTLTDSERETEAVANQTLGWEACANAVRALIAARSGDTVSVFALEAMLTAAEDEEAARLLGDAAEVASEGERDE